MPRFVILEHDHPERHWDLLFEAGEVLWAWRLFAPPSPGAVIPAERSFDHRLLYLDYEGPVSGGRGTVRRWAHGEFAWREVGPHRLVADVTGPRLAGTVVLEQGVGGWQMTFETAAPRPGPPTS